MTLVMKMRVWLVALGLAVFVWLGWLVFLVLRAHAAEAFFYFYVPISVLPALTMFLFPIVRPTDLSSLYTEFYFAEKGLRRIRAIVAKMLGGLSFGLNWPAFLLVLYRASRSLSGLRAFQFYTRVPLLSNPSLYFIAAYSCLFTLLWYGCISWFTPSRYSIAFAYVIAGSIASRHLWLLLLPGGLLERIKR